MTVKILLYSLAVVLAIGVLIGANKVLAQSNQSVGEIWLQLDEDSQQFFVAGSVETAFWIYAVLDEQHWLVRCLRSGGQLRGASTSQWRAIVERYLRAHPNQWHLPMPVAILAAMAEACRR